MTLDVRWSPLAIQRVEEATAYIARDKPEAALRWADGIFDVVGRLADFPKSGRVVPETKREEIREVQYGAYRVVYRIERERVLILTVRHSRQLLDPNEIA